LATRNKVGAVVLAAGQSKRFRSARSKLLHPFGGKPLIQWPLAALAGIGASPVVVVVEPGAEDLEAACGAGVEFARQAKPLGTGHAALTAEPRLRAFEGPILIVNGDLPLLGAETLAKLLAVHLETRPAVTLLTAVVPNSHGWGRIRRKPNGAIEAIVEERDAGDAERALTEVNVGVYCTTPGFLFPALRRFSPDNAQGEIYLTDIVAHALAVGSSVAGVSAPADEVGQINDRAELAAMEKTLRERINRRWMEAGVTLEDPDAAYIGPEVTIGRDTHIGPNVHLRGRTRVGEGCRIDGSAFLTDATLGDGVHLRFGVVMTEAEADSHCEIGPFAHLRPGTRLGEEVHIGDFVETKNARLGRRAKANHLAYLGDAEIGAETNIGAGTITCNYDGFQKHPTVVGDRVQIGSDTQLVAPVTLGDDVYVASGTTVRRDVPSGALVFNPRQEAHREGWVKVRREREAAKKEPRKKRKSG
jgi:bifunctional UDP-N-acetylglucosamine pyrophosphorylase/glucosamine-1-phosphate N-acetyltransferase